MPNLNTARFSLTGMGEVRALKDRLEDRWVTVKDFGATGNGSTNDRPYIQAAFDYAFRPEGDPNGEANAHLNKIVFFPRGLYRIAGAPLRLNRTDGATLIGAGSHQSRIFWSGAAVEGEKEDFYPVIECCGAWRTQMEGLTFDASGVQNTVMICQDFPTWADDGSDGYYRDVHITGAVKIGGIGGNGVVMGAGSAGAMASERTWIKCKFTNCAGQGYRLVHSNALNHEFFGCTFANCEFGLRGLGGPGSVVANGCWFENNSLLDIRTQTNQTQVQSCHSTSQQFASVSGILIGNTHINASEGEFIGLFNLAGPDNYMNTDNNSARLIGNHSTSGTVTAHAAESINMGVSLTGNRFDNGDYLDGTLAATHPTLAFVDGVNQYP